MNQMIEWMKMEFFCFRIMKSSSAQLHNCEQCDYKAKCSGSLKRHVKMVHLRIKNYTCEQCDAKFSQPSGLKDHRDAVDKGVRYTCGLCNCKAKWLKTHQVAASQDEKLPL